MKSRKLGIALLVMLAFVVTSGTFAYWASSVQGDTQQQIGQSVTIGTGNEVTTTVSFGALSSQGRTLIPATYANGTSTFSSTTFTFPVEWDADSGEAGSGFLGDLVVTLSDPTLTGGTLTLAQINAMFTFQVTTAPATLTEGAAPVDVIVTVTFANEPATEAIYNEIESGTLSFNVTFAVTPQ
jgi:predicted ribosomally synthesized peptide with SipW-like signal peptide